MGDRKSSIVIPLGLAQCLEVNYLNIIQFFSSGRGKKNKNAK